MYYLPSAFIIQISPLTYDVGIVLLVAHCYSSMLYQQVLLRLQATGGSIIEDNDIGTSEIHLGILKLRMKLD